MRSKHVLTRAAVAGGLACWSAGAGGAGRRRQAHKVHIGEPYAFVAEDYCGLEDVVEIEGLFRGGPPDPQPPGAWTTTSEHQVITETHTLGDVTTLTRVSKPMFKDLKIVDLGDTVRITVLGTGPESTYGPDGKAIARNPGQFRLPGGHSTRPPARRCPFEVLKESTGRTDASARSSCRCSWAESRSATALPRPADDAVGWRLGASLEGEDRRVDPRRRPGSRWHGGASRRPPTRPAPRAPAAGTGSGPGCSPTSPSPRGTTGCGRRRSSRRCPDGEHRVVEGRGTGPLEAHALVARHVDDQAARSEGRGVGRAEVGQRRGGVLEGAVDDDVALGEERRDRDPAAFGDHVAEVRRRRCLWSNCRMRTEWMGEPTAATSRVVSTAASWMPWALSAVTAPRAVAPKPITTARSRRP